MATDTATQEATQADAPGESQVDTIANPQAGEAEKTYSQTAYKKVQSEAINLRQRLLRYEEAEKAGMTEAERLEKERKEFAQERASFQQERRAATVENIARRLGAVYPDAMHTLISAEAETEKDIEKALATLQKDRPKLFQTGSADGGARGGDMPADFNQQIRDRMAGRR